MRTKTFLKYPCALFLTSVVFFTACSKKSTDGGTSTPSNETVSITVDKSTITADGFDEATFVVKDQNGNDVTSASTIYVNGSARSQKSYWTETSGIYKIKAQKGSVSSSEITVTAVDKGTSPFTQKSVVEDYTGTWCGYCPRVGMKLESYILTHPNTIVIANHGGSSSEPYLFQYHSNLASTYGVTGYPNAIVDRNFKWNESNTSLDQAANRWAPLGLALETSIASGIINVKARVKFNVNAGIDTRLVVYLVEDGLVYPQVNYSANGNGLPNPISNYVHNATLRKTFSDVYGDMIDKNKQKVNEIFEKNFTLNISSFSYNVSKLRVIAFVEYGINNYLGKKGVGNVQSVVVGSNKSFD